MENSPSGQARRNPNAEAMPEQVCQLCGRPDCPGAMTGNVRQAIRRGEAFDSPPYGYAEAWCHGGERMLVAEHTHEFDVLTDIIIQSSGGAPWRRIAAWLNERGARMRDGGAWTWPRVRAVAKFVYKDQWLLPE